MKLDSFSLTSAHGKSLNSTEKMESERPKEYRAKPPRCTSGRACVVLQYAAVQCGALLLTVNCMALLLTVNCMALLLTAAERWPQLRRLRVPPERRPALSTSISWTGL